MSGGRGVDGGRGVGCGCTAPGVLQASSVNPTAPATRKTKAKTASFRNSIAPGHRSFLWGRHFTSADLRDSPPSLESHQFLLYTLSHNCHAGKSPPF